MGWFKIRNPNIKIRNKSKIQNPEAAIFLSTIFLSFPPARRNPKSEA